MEDKPRVRTRYQYDFRDGTKGSTAWGDANQGPVGVRKIVPAFWRLDEDRHSISLDVEHTIKNTEVGIGGRAEFTAYDNARYMRRNYLESRALPAPPAGQREVFDRFITHREGFESDLYSVHAFTQTDLSEQWKFTTGYSFTTMDTDVSGDRFYG